MSKIMKMTMAALTVLLMSSTVATTANAATWHKGTPKALRGKWAHSVKKLQKYVDGKGVGTKQIYCDKNEFSFAYYKKNKPLFPMYGLTNTKYKKISTTKYLLKGVFGNSGMSSTEPNTRLQIVKKGNKIKYKYSPSGHNKYSKWFYKI